MDVKQEENERELSQTIIWSDSINAWIDYPSSLLSKNTETGSHVGLLKERTCVPTVSPQTTSRGQILRIFPEMTGASDGENRGVKIVYFCKDQDTISTSERHSIKEESGHVSTLSDSFEAQINPKSQGFSRKQTRTNNELPVDNVNIQGHSTAITSVLTSPAIESGYNLSVSNIIPEYCEPLNFPSDEEEDYNTNLRRRLQCQKTVEDKYLWQCRGCYSKPNPKRFGKYLKDPYAKCKEIGIDFHVRSGARQKLDLHLLTIGVMIEVSEYVKNINRSNKHVIFDILDYNFDLGVQNEVRGYFSNKIERKLNDMLKMYTKRRNPEWLKEVFELPDSKTMNAWGKSRFARSNLNNSVSENPTPFDICIKEKPVVDLIAPLHVTTENLSTQTDVTRCAETAILDPENGPNDICTRDKSDLGVIHHVKTETVSTQTDMTMDQSFMMPTVEEALSELYPICKEKGLDLDVKSTFGKKEKLDLRLLTREVMIELADFTSQMCGNWKQMVCDVVEHNFDLDLKSGKTDLAEDIINRLRAALQPNVNLKLHDHRLRCELEKEYFFLKNSCKLKNDTEMSSNQVTTASFEPNDQMKEVSKRRRLDLMKKEKEMDTCVARETEGVRFEVRPVESHCVKKERISDETDLALCIDETKQIVVTNLDQSNVTSNTKKVVNACYTRCEEIGLDLDVAFKPSKKKLEFQLLTNGVVFEVYKYAKIKPYPLKAEGWGHILYAILEYNFDLSLQNQRRSQFQFWIYRKVKRMVKKHRLQLTRRDKLSKELFVIPNVIQTKAKKTVL
ncbi:uncharacterized protein [Salmo salar]|uniref:Uncharacterized protein LOC106611477 n=1 Tax=Salmo salar TaxID=8030 RepID=A0ABM3F8T8_SALSA|nr:uncharacterized protein LOC106611477 [Salmo salar]XP_045579704.1 uncharacterized protein LOC106611477 [Salmo salar]